MSFLGGRKLLWILQQDPCWDNLGVGRDRFFKILKGNGLLIRKRRSYRIKTTNSNHWLKRYPNLIKDLTVTRADQVWVSDITYVKMTRGFSYLFLITDVYSSRIMGHYLSENMLAESGVKALKMAIQARKHAEFPLIHHSDRGSQYCSHEYTSLLKENDILISMTEDSNPGENAKAERVNGILKEEFKISKSYQNYSQAVKGVNENIRVYNSMRPHLSCDYLTPEIAYMKTGPLKRHWKDYKKEQSES